MGLWLSTGLLALAPQESADLPLAKSTDESPTSSIRHGDAILLALRAWKGELQDGART